MIQNRRMLNIFTVNQMHKLSFVSFLLAALLGLTAWPAQAGTRQAWQGRIGSVPIVMEFEIDPARGDVEGRYFYRRYHTDIRLHGERGEDGKLHLVEGWGEGVDDAGPNRKMENHLVLSRKGNGWEGEWQGGKARLTVVLEPLEAAEPAAVKAAELRPAVPYEVARRAGLALKAETTLKFMGYTLEWREEPLSRIRMFRVRDGFSAEALQRISDMLEEARWQQVSEYFSCNADKDSTAFEQTVTPRFLNARFLSVSRFTRSACPNRQPKAYGYAVGDDLPLNLDIKNGRICRTGGLSLGWNRREAAVRRSRPPGEVRSRGADAVAARNHDPSPSRENGSGEEERLRLHHGRNLAVAGLVSHRSRHCVQPGLCRRRPSRGGARFARACAEGSGVLRPTGMASVAVERSA